MEKIMASSRTSPTKMSKGKPHRTRHMNKGIPDAEPNPSRAHRGDTPEAKRQRARAPKTHPRGRTPGATRKDREKTGMRG